MKKTLIFLFVLFVVKLHAQDKILPAEARPFVLKGYEMLDYITGDLNGDKRMDAILVLRVSGEDTSFADDIIRPAMLLIRQPNGKLKIEKRNDKMIMCAHCGGVFGDPYAGITIKNKGFVLNFYGGSNDRWSYEYSFAYDTQKKTWVLTHEKDENYKASDPEKTMQQTLIESTELESITTVDNFSGGAEVAETKWKVAAAKTFFYSNPKSGSKPRKGYLLKDDVVTGFRELKDFVEVSFSNKRENFSYGFVLKKDLLKLK